MSIKSYFKWIFIIVLTIVFICSPFTHVLATGSVISDADKFINDANPNLPINDSSLKAVSSNLYNILLTIGIVVATIAGVFLGIQFVTGSIETKSKVKESLIPYFAGCIVIFGAFGIWKLVVTLLTQIS